MASVPAERVRYGQVHSPSAIASRAITFAAYINNKLEQYKAAVNTISDDPGIYLEKHPIIAPYFLDRASELPN